MTFPGMPCLSIQISFFPLLNGGFYFTGPHGPLNRLIRVGFGIGDIRIMWDSRTGPINVPPR